MTALAGPRRRPGQFRIGLLALAMAACSAPPRKVGGQPSWRQPGEPDPSPAPTPAAVALTVAPKTAATAAYNDPPRTAAPSTPVGDALAAEIIALAPPGAVPVADGRLYAAASALAEVVPSEGILPYPLVEFALQHHGIVEPSPNLLVVWGPLDRPQLLADNLRPRLAEILHGEPQRRFGIGTAQRGDRAAIVVMLQASFVDTQPIPRSLALGASAPLRGQIAAGFAEPEAFVTGDDGQVSRLALTTTADGQFTGTLRCGPAVGRLQVEVAADDHTGSTVLANFPVWCGQAPPATATAAVDADDAAPVTSAAAAEARLLTLLNRDRVAAGRAPLVMVSEVAAVARAHSQDMRDHGFVGHISPTTGSAADRVAAAGIKSGVVLENIARAYGPAEAQAGLMNSPGHRANALSTAATHIGIGVVLGDEVAGRRELYVTEVFIRIPPALDPVAAHRLLAGRFRADAHLEVDPALDAIAATFATALAAGTPRDQARRAISRDLDALANRYRQAASVVTAVTDLDGVEARELVGDTVADQVGIGIAQGPHPELGPGAYWIVLILAAAR
ncbi:MAG: CAP domain-containing protein [Kofleriaceae bacterium]